MKDIISEIIGRVRAEKQIQADTVTAGINVNSFDDYNPLVGRYEGFAATLDIINEILREDEEDL